MASSYAEIHRESRTLLRSARRAWSCSSGSYSTAVGILSRRLVEKTIRSMTELRIRAGTVFYYDRTLVLTIVEIILVQYVNLLVAY